MLDETQLRGFACPQAELNRAVLDLLVVDHCRQVLLAFLDRHGEDVAASSSRLTDVLARWAAHGDGFEAAWSLAFGDMHAALVIPTEVDVTRVAAAVGLRLNGEGTTGMWEARLNEPAAFRFGRWLLPRASAIRVESTKDTVDVELKTLNGTSVVAFRRGRDGWSASNGIELPIVDRAGVCFSISPASALTPEAGRRLLDADAYSFDISEVADDVSWHRVCEESVDLLSEAAPEYVPWVGAVLRDLVPLQARPRVFNSGSDRYSPGVVCLSNQPYRWVLAEMLVHECTHQYMNIVTRLGSIDDGTDHELHFSPFRNKDRPIMFLVVAYHAFANVLLFYRSARARGMVPEPIPGQEEAFTNREATLARQLEQIEGPLAVSTALTPIGRALWEPLRGLVGTVVA